MTSPDRASLVLRLARLESRCRSLQCLVFGQLALLLVVLLVGADAPARKFDGTVQARRFVVVDAKGVTRGVFGLAYGSSDCSVALFHPPAVGADPAVAVDLSAGSGGHPSLSLLDADGRRSVHAACPPDGGLYLGGVRGERDVNLLAR